MEFSFDGFYKLPHSIRSFLTGVILLTPFWYLDLFLFKKGFVSHDYVQVIPLIAAFCLSLTWFVISYISADVMVGAIKAMGEEEKHERALGLISSLLAVIFSVLTISVFTFWGYYAKWDFGDFIFGIYIFTCIWVIIWRFITYRVAGIAKERELRSKKGELKDQIM